MTKKFNTFRIPRKTLLMSLMMCGLFLCSCKSNAQEHKEKERTHKEGAGHDRDGEGHGKEVKGHDNDSRHKMSKERGEHLEGERGEHNRDTGESREGEEDGTQFSLNDTYNVTKHGVQLILKYDRSSNAFKGYMLNTTVKNIERARVEVHLSNGTELGPTKAITLAPKMKQEVVLKATDKPFKSWSTHAEVGNNEHGHESEMREGHSKREKGEHGGDKKDNQ